MAYDRTLLASFVMAMVLSAPAPAQTTTSAEPGASGGERLEEITVSARKKEESLISVPVQITVMTSADLDTHAVNGVDEIARMVPGLAISEGGGTGQGGAVSLRGIAGPAQNPIGDQAVSFNIDGFSIAKSSVRRMGEFDLAQAEVLKGPQTLFFGKDSPGGVISLTTADPTPQFEAGFSNSYEFFAREERTEDYISGPLTDTLGGRLAVVGDNMRGWVHDTSTASTNPWGVTPDNPYGPNSTEYDLRATLKWDPSDTFNARFKLTYGHMDGAGPAYNYEMINCPYGTPQLDFVSSCKAGSTVQHQGIGTFFSGYEPQYGDGAELSRRNQALASLELNYDITKELKLTSVTGAYYFYNYDLENFDPDGLASLPSNGLYTDREVSQEFRVASSFDSPLNFAAGGIYSNTKTTNHADTNLLIAAYGATPAHPLNVNNYYFTQDGQAYSVFGQLQYKIIPELEFDIGGRYSHEEKRLPLLRQDVGFAPYGSPGATLETVTPLTNQVSFNNFSPDVTLNYRPTSTLTVYGTYKWGFLSGGFNANAQSPTLPLNYAPENIKGEEGGVKVELLDRTLGFNVGIFNYVISGLQVTQYINTTSLLLNAGQATIRGVDIDGNWVTPIPGLKFQGAMEYNHARYNVYAATCYTGEDQAQGCDYGPATGGLYDEQNLSGKPLANAPNWAADAGFAYEKRVFSNLMLGITNDYQYSSSFYTDAEDNPLGVVPEQVIINASLRLYSEDQRWSLSVIGLDLNDKYYWNIATQVPFTGGATGGKTGQLSDEWAVTSRGREVLLKWQYKFK